MTSKQSDTESNVSGFIRYNEKGYKYLYTSIIEGMCLINQDIVEIEKNLKNIIQQAGPLEAPLAALLQSLPRPDKDLRMETE